jgi:hypothetical protein
MNKTDKILIAFIVIIFLGMVAAIGWGTMLFYDEFGVFPWHIFR